MESSIFISQFFCNFFFGTFTLYVRFIVVYSTIASYVLFILYCTTLEVRICVQPQYNFIVRTLYNSLYYVLVLICLHPICIILLLRHKYSAPLQHRRNWCQPPLPTACRPSRANGGDPVPAPMVDLPFQRLLTLVHPTHVPPTSHPIHPSHPSHSSSNQPAHKSQCFLIRSS